MYIFIINPKAGNGRAMKVFSDLQKSSIYQEIDNRYYFTEYEGHGEIITRKITSNVEVTAIIVIGGDGTIHEVINGLGTMDTPIGFIPGGSGNDFARGCRIKGKPEAILKQIINKKPSLTYWLGNYWEANNERRFVNNIGFGFDAEIAHTVNHSSYKKFFNSIGFGTLSYIIALLQVLIYFKPMSVTIEVDGVKRQLEKCWMVSIGNHPYYGGGMKVIPNAVIQPNILPVLIIHSISKRKVLALFMTVFLGIHQKYKEVEMFEATTLGIISEQIIRFQVDGQTNQCRSCFITKQAESLKIIGTSPK